MQFRIRSFNGKGGKKTNIFADKVIIELIDPSLIFQLFANSALKQIFHPNRTCYVFIMTQLIV